MKDDIEELYKSKESSKYLKVDETLVIKKLNKENMNLEKNVNELNQKIIELEKKTKSFKQKLEIMINYKLFLILDRCNRTFFRKIT